MAATKKKQSKLPEPLRACVQAIDDKKGESIKILYVGNISSVTDYFVIATGTSNPHLRALGNAVEQVLDELDTPVIKSGSGDLSGWFMVDAFDFMVHVFTDETRQFYNLEGLWKDAEIIELETAGIANT